MKFSGKFGNGPVNRLLNFDGDPNHCLDTEIVFQIRRYWEIRKVHPVVHSYCMAVVVIIKLAGKQTNVYWTLASLVKILDYTSIHQAYINILIYNTIQWY